MSAQAEPLGGLPSWLTPRCRACQERLRGRKTGAPIYLAQAVTCDVCGAGTTCVWSRKQAFGRGQPMSDVGP